MTDKLIVGIVQASPIFMNLEASLAKAVSLVEQAANKGAQIVAFGETWLAGYPAWLDFCPNAALWNHEPTKEVFVPGAETKTLGEIAAKYKIVLIIGINERVEQGAGNGTLYNSLLTFGADGKLAGHHRKLVPTYTERIVWGAGDAAGLKAVKTDFGRVGSLVCWEHWMPLARQAMHDSGEHIHVAIFPTVHQMHQIASRHYAFEGRCFVLAAGLIMKTADLPAPLLDETDLSKLPENILRGGSCVIAPDGSFISEPVFDAETIIVAELDLMQIDKEKMTLDVSGHYSRTDVFDFAVKRNRRT